MRIVWVFLAVTLLIAVGVGVAVSGLDEADQVASVSSAIIAVIGLAVTLRLSRGGADRPLAVPAPDGRKVPRQLPLAVRHFTGRTEQLERLTKLKREGCGLVVISGEGGIGKSALAVTWGHAVRDRFPDGDLFVNLNGYSEQQRLSAEEVLSGFLRALGVPPDDIGTDVESLSADFRTLMHGRRMLMILDNAHPDTPLERLLPGSPTCMTIITSRDRFRYTVAAHGAEAMPLRSLSDAAAIRLVRRIAALPELDEETADMIAGLCSNRPLYLRLAAQRVNELGGGAVEVLFAEIGEEERFVESLSYRSLDAEAARMFRLLALPDLVDISPPTAAALCDVPVARARRLLAKLSGAALLEEPVAGRYRFHDVIGTFAREAVLAEESAEERSRALDRLFEHCAGTAEDAGRYLSSRGTDTAAGLAFTTLGDALVWCESERLNLLTIMRQALDLGENEKVWRIMFGLIYFFRRRGYFQNWLDTAGMACTAAAQAGDLAAQAQANRTTGGASYFSYRYDDAISYYSAALELWRRLGNRNGEGIELGNLAHVFRAVNRLAEARNNAERSLVLLREHGTDRSVSIVLRTLGELDLAGGDADGARAHMEEALALARSAADQLEEGYALHSLAEFAADQNAFDEAFAFYEEAIEVRRSCHDRVGLAESLGAFGLLLTAGGDRSRARPLLTEALAIFEEIGDSNAAAPVRAALGG